MKLTVTLPVYNERHTIREIVKRVIAAPVEKEIIIVDDASSDGTTEILKEMEKELPIKTIYADINHGRGMAVRMGLEAATGEIHIAQDADLEYDPNDLTSMMKPIVEGGADVVYGSRFKGDIQGMAYKNVLGNKFLTFLTNTILRAGITDLMTGYKMIRTDLLRSIKFETQGFEFEAELTAKLVKSGIRIHEVPVSFRGRGKAEGKKIGWRDAIKVMNVLRKYG